MTDKARVATSAPQAKSVDHTATKHYAQFSSRLVQAEPAQRIEQIRAGVEAGVLVDASRHFSITQQRMGQLLGIPSTTLARWLKADKHLGPSETERLARIAQIEAEAIDVFGSSDKAKAWLFTENKALGEAPITMLDTDLGKGEVKKALNAIAYGGAV